MFLQYNFVDNDLSKPVASKKGAYGSLKVQPQIVLLSAEGRSTLGKKYKDVTGTTLPTFEQLRQRSGLVLYETTLNESKGVLEIKEPRDWIYVYVDGVS